MTQFFLSVHREKKWSHFDQSQLSHWRNQNFTQLFRSKWLNFSLPVDREKKLSHYDLKSWVTGGIEFDPTFWVKMTQFFAQWTERNNWVISTLKVESLAELKFDPNFKVKMSQFFSQCTDRKKLSHFDQKFESLAELKFDLKSWVTGGIVIRPSKVSNWIIFESIGLSMLSQFDSQCWVNLTFNVESIWLPMLSQFDS